jgi:hypothetical protein
MMEEPNKRNVSGDVHLKSKADLLNVLAQMEADDLCMLDGEDVILTG